MPKLTHEELLRRQALACDGGIPVEGVLNDIRSLYNVGAIFRTADGAGLRRLWLCGITGIPPSSRITKTALGAEETVAWEYRRDVCALIEERKRAGFEIVSLEQTQRSIPYHEFSPSRPLCLIAGNETGGVDEGAVSLADHAIEIPMAGTKNSLNVAVAFAVAVYHLRQVFLSLRHRTVNAL